MRTQQLETRVYEAGALLVEGFPLADVSDHLAHADRLVWVDLCRPSERQLTQLAEELGLHELAIEDALEPNRRPKLDRYESHVFLSARAVQADADAGELREAELGVFAGDRWLVTVRQDESFDMSAVVERWGRSHPLTAEGVTFLMHCLLDVVVDGYFDALEVFDRYYDEVSDGIFSEQPVEPSRQRHWFQMRQALVRFHRMISPTREIISALMRREHQLPEALYPYYQDLYDHALRVGESTETLRELVSTIVETNLGLRDYRQNQIMKKVTSWAAIIAVPTLITGYYGMNVPYPGSGAPWGVALSAGLIASLSGALYLLFRRNDWL